MIPPGAAWFRVVLPPAAGGSAIAAIHVGANDPGVLRSVLELTSGGDIGVGEHRLRRLFDVDAGVVARLSPTGCVLMPHGSALVVQQITEQLRLIGVVERIDADCFPEASDRVEALMLETLARAASPLAIDALLRQPRAWRERPPKPDAETTERSRILRRLIDPPTVAAIGLANVGKSSLLNALARRTVAVVSPEAGTTRDHVGATLDLAGLVVHWVDTPGWRAAPEPIETRAFEMAIERVATADLIVLCGDAEHGFADPERWKVSNQPVVRCGTKADLGVVAGSDVGVSCVREGGVEPLAQAIREALVPQELLSDARAWIFDPRLAEIGVA